MRSRAVGQLSFADWVRDLRWNRMRLSRTEFEARYGIPARTLQDIEQGRTRGTRSLAVLLATIEASPKTVEMVVAGLPQLLQSTRGNYVRP